ncbi:MAG: 2,4-dihydroxyhept-2-ene-1,7-dioic acid aldolase [Alphaproteobacteria bacterium]|nr:2,4-dihydroxyhept-2-ene-1,7-dioic acid aldolase [Alphaproteobacteria bacterium]
MRANRVKEMLFNALPVVNGWCSLPCAYSAEVMAHQGYDSLTIDMQHGAIGYETAVMMLCAISTTATVPFVRVPWHDPGIMMKLLDAGAYGLICPMVNTAEIAERFVAACRYPPRGFRSFGPNRATLYSEAGSSAAYAAAADGEILLFAMIETREGLANLDEILSVPGLDGIYIGPGDLSLALGAQPTMNPRDATVLEAMAKILQAARRHGRFAAVHTDGPVTARDRFSEGFGLCTLQNDVRLLADGAKNQVEAARTLKS